MHVFEQASILRHEARCFAADVQPEHAVIRRESRKHPAYLQLTPYSKAASRAARRRRDGGRIAEMNQRKYHYMYSDRQPKSA
jgi:hypothetical protein